MFSREHTRTKTNKRLRAKQTKGAARSWSFDSVFSMSVFAPMHIGVRPDVHRGSRLMKPGMTLIELMVSVTILTVVVLIAGRLMTSARDAVQLAEEGIAANTDHRAIAQRLRADVAMLTRTGYMAIVSGGTAGGKIETWPGTHALAFTAVGPFRSRYPDDTHQANAARVDYGIARAYRTAAGTAPTILFRRAILLTDDPNDPNALGRPRDYEPIPLAYQATLTRSQLAGPLPNGFLINPYSYGANLYPGMVVPPGGADGTDASPPPMSVPAVNLDQINRLWPYLAGNGIAFTVEWTDGKNASGDPVGVSELLPWYGITNPKDNGWIGNGPDSQEFSLNGNYCALWTSQNKDNWPRALKIQYQLISSRHTYEIIVDLPQP